jgi:hypothetical protein
MDVHVQLREERSGRWVATADVADVRATGITRERALANIRRALARSSGGPDGLNLMVEATPLLAGVAEAAAIMGWDKRRIITYINRGRFPAPIQTLASGRVWLRRDLERFAAEWHARHRARPGGR